MKNILIAITMGIILLAPLTLADQVNMEINVNGTANLNITVDADDTLAREMIGETQGDLYGTMTGSGPKDMLLDEIEAGVGNPITSTDGLDSIVELCNDPFLQQYLNSIGGLPPLEFVDYVKALGYDDEAHINFVWTMCQQQYINNQEGNWMADTGVKLPDMVRVIVGAVDWLSGRETNPPESYKQIGSALESYFASDRDIQIIVNKIREQELRLQAMEITMERIASDQYCDVKLEFMEKYNLSYVKCGENSTIYAKVNPDEFGYDILGYTNDERCEEDWVCTAWSECKDGEMERTCADVNLCGTEKEKPAETQGCMVIETLVEKEPEEEQPKISYAQIPNIFSNLMAFFPLFIV